MTVIVVGAEKGGTAKSRTATNIGVLAACDGVDVVLLDTDRQGSSTSFANIRKVEGIEPLLPVLTLPPNPAAELANLSKRYELVIVDIGAQNYKTMLECSLLADLVIVPCGADQQEIESTMGVFATLKNAGPKHAFLGQIPAHVLLTRVSPVENAKATMEVRTLFADAGVSVFDAQLAYRSAWMASGKTGRAVTELKGKDRSDKAAAEMEAVYQEIVKKIKGVAK